MTTEKKICLKVYEKQLGVAVYWPIYNECVRPGATAELLSCSVLQSILNSFADCILAANYECDMFNACISKLQYVSKYYTCDRYTGQQTRSGRSTCGYVLNKWLRDLRSAEVTQSLWREYYQVNESNIKYRTINTPYRNNNSKIGTYESPFYDFCDIGRDAVKTKNRCKFGM